MTTSAAVYTFLFIHIGVILVVTAYFTVGAAVAPTLTSRARHRFAQRPWLPAIIGLVISVPWIAVALVLLNLPSGAFKFAGAAAGCLCTLAAPWGRAATPPHSGGGRPATADWIQTVRGGLFITLTWILPLVGWLGILPLTLATGVGCLVLGLFPVQAQREAVPM